MDTITILILIAIIVIVFYVIISKKFEELKKEQKPSDELLEIIKMLQEGSQKDRKVLLSSLQKNTESLNSRLDNAAKVISEVQKNIGEMSEIGRSMKDLQDFLKSPKLRGNVGEHVLKELLAQMLPKNSFNLQYTFKSGEKVDAAIKTEAGIIPIDSKFPMENFRKMVDAKSDNEKQKAQSAFNKDVKKHIGDISKKYILTEEGTIDYALMYIPSEAVYYEIVNNPKLFEHASEKRILPVSPTTFYAYMRAILMSFEGQKIEREAQEILASLRAVKKDYTKVEDNLGVLHKHLTNAGNMLGNVMSTFERLGNSIARTGELGESVKKEAKKLE